MKLAKIPIALPATSAIAILVERLKLKLFPTLKTTPAFAKANSGIITYDTQPCNECSRYCNGGAVFSEMSSNSSIAANWFLVRILVSSVIFIAIGYKQIQGFFGIVVKRFGIYFSLQRNC
jgi:hypothetical protein